MSKQIYFIFVATDFIDVTIRGVNNQQPIRSHFFNYTYISWINIFIYDIIIDLEACLPSKK